MSKSFKRIRHDQSCFLTLLDVKFRNWASIEPDASQFVVMFCDRSVTDFREVKAIKYKEKLSLYLNKSRCHAHPRAMRAHAYMRGRARSVTDFRYGFDLEDQYRIEPTERSRVTRTILGQHKNATGRMCKVAVGNSLGTSAATRPFVGRGNGRQVRESLFPWSKRPELQLVNTHASELGMVQPNELNVGHAVYHQLLLKPEDPLSTVLSFHLCDVKRCVGPVLSRGTNWLIGVHHLTPERMRNHD
jgi:hypothetical protein